MNRIYQSIWNNTLGVFVAASENAHGRGGKRRSARKGARCTNTRFAINTLSACLMVTFGAAVHALPAGGVVAAGGATISSSANTTTINQTTANVIINWQSFGIAAGQTTQFNQPSSSAVALNRVVGADPSVIMGNLNSNGKVFLVNPHGILFGAGSSVNVGGLVASTMSISDANFLAGNYAFTDAGTGSVVNQGTITAADGGYVALLGKTVINQGVIVAKLGTVALAAGNAATLDMGGDGLLNVSVSQGAVNALVENGGMIQADAGRVFLTAQAAGNLLHTVVNNTGVIQAQTIGTRNGTIMLLGDMETGTMNVGGTLDVSAPNGGNGGFIETSAANVRIHGGTRTAAAPLGLPGTWLIDPQNFIIGLGGNYDNGQLSADLVNINVNIVTAPGPGEGDIFVNGPVSWTAAAAPTTLTLTAARDVNINSAITATNGNLVVCCGRDVNVNAPISVTDGSVSLSGGRNVNQNAAITMVRGNLQMCAANDVNVNAKIALTNGNAIVTRSLGLPLGLTLIADSDGTGPGIEGGTVNMNVTGASRPSITGTAGTAAPVTIHYNPVSYTAPTDYLPKFILVDSALTQRMLVFPEVTRTFDGSNAATLVGLKGNPAGVTLIADPGSTAFFSGPGAGANQSVSFTGYRLGGPNASLFALATTCCGPIVGKTTGTILPAVVRPSFNNLMLASLSLGLLPDTIVSDSDSFLTIEEEADQLAPASEALAPYVPRRFAPRRQRN